MHPFFRVTSDEIQRLNDVQARELVAQLCKAELSRKSLSSSAVLWGGDQRASDGGIDVSVDVKESFVSTGYIQRATSGFQVKAEEFSAGKILEEMAPKNVLRGSIIELIDSSGAYIIVSTRDSCSPTMLAKRLKAMTDSVKSHPNSAKLHLDFFDSRKIADWASNHKGIVVWIKDCLGGALQNWKPYAPWAYREDDVTSEYLLDKKVKVSTPKHEDGMEVIEAINNLREQLIIKGASIRIVGLSGVGKTRLVQALFDERIATSQPALAQDNVIYTDLSHSPSPLPNAVLEALNITESDSVVVVDNCGQDVHQQLTDILKRDKSKLKLITIEYDIRDHQPEGTNCYHLEGSSNEVISQLLTRHYKNLSDLDINKIVDFSDGNARVAFALAATSEAKGQLAKLQDEDLFKRLFLQNHIENDELQRCAEAASLLYSFDFDDQDTNSELPLLASLAEVSATAFHRSVVELQSRGLVQSRGKWRAVLPHAIANRLATNAVQMTPAAILIKSFIINATERVARSFSRRLGYLHESTVAQSLVNRLLGNEGYLNDVSNLNPLQWEIFENLAPVNQSDALDAIVTVLKSGKHSSMRDSTSATRILRSLAYEEKFFNKACDALLEFVLIEPAEKNYDQAIEILKSLFYANLSGTLASPEQRADYIRRLITNPDKKIVEVGFELLEASLDNSYPSGNFSYEFGALKRSYGWSPQTHEDNNRWYKLFIQIALDVGKNDSPVGSKVRNILGSAFRGLWSYSKMECELINAVHEFSKTAEWVEGWIGIRTVLQYDSKAMSPESLANLKSLDKLIEPKDIRSKIQAKILSRGTYSIDLEAGEDYSIRGKTSKAYDEAKELGKLVAKDISIIADLTPFLQPERISDKLDAFGVGIGENFTNVQVLLDQLRPFYIPPLKPGLNCQFVGGLIQGWFNVKPEDVESFLDDALEDEAWGPLFLTLQLSLFGGINQSGYQRIIKSLDIGLVETWRYSNLANGRALDTLTVAQIADLLHNLNGKSDKGLQAAIDILYMVIYAAKSDPKDMQYQSELRDVCFDLICIFDWSILNSSNQNLMIHLEEVLEFGLNGVTPSKQGEALKRILHFESERKLWAHKIGALLVPFFKNAPRESLDIIITVQDKSRLYRALTLSTVRNPGYAVHVVPDDILIEWCDTSPEDRFLFAATTCKLFEQANPTDEDSVEKGFTRTAIQIFDSAPIKAEILKIFVARLSPNAWSGSRSVIMSHRLAQIDQLNPANDPVIQSLIEVEKVRFAEIVEKEAASERIRDQGILESFE